ncbi:hypothetical protein CHS0354_037995 [Potamilus streckersoni]|uniref:Autophagy-related protein 2 n=1 Tax=Potamilus streckersoni TaxID=2493646 RepID=A0AAE0WCL1_9BIVA|nr:hypothetical protein CHS0354_037995 [Potamilus streckersoni]
METMYTFLSWKDFVKKRACRYLLQHYLGQFLKEKLTLDQLSIDLYNGTGTISNLVLDVEALNDNLDSLSIPLEIIDGFVNRISVSVPWGSLVHDSTQVEIHGLELTLKPKQRYHNVAPLGEMFCSMSMTSSLQLAQHCLESEKDPVEKQMAGTEKIEGVQKFAQMIDLVLTKIKVTLMDTVVRLEHIPTASEKGVALEVRIKRIDFFDELLKTRTSEGTSVDGGHRNSCESSGIANKNLHIEGLQIFFDEINNVKAKQKHSMGPMPELSVNMCASVIGSFLEDPPKNESRQSSALPSNNSDPVLVAIVTGQQELKLKLKQNDTLQGPKLNLNCQFGSLYILLSPRQLHGILELASGLAAPVSSVSSPRRDRGTKSRPMTMEDQKRVEMDLQNQMLTNRLLSHQGYSIHFPLQSLDSEEDHYFSLSGDSKTYTDNDALMASTYSASTVPGSTHDSNSGKTHRESGGSASKYREEPSTEQIQCNFKLAFFSATILHNDPVICPNNSPTCFSPIKSMEEVSHKFFQQVGNINVLNPVHVKEFRKEFEELIAHDHIRLVGRPLNVEYNQKSSIKESSFTVNVTMGLADMVETLYAKQGTVQVPVVNELLVFQQDDKRQMYTSMQGATTCVSLDINSVEHTRVSHRIKPHSQITVELSLGEFTSEVDITIVDRISNLIKPEAITTSASFIPASSFYHIGSSLYTLSRLDDGPPAAETEISIGISCPASKILLRFPVPDLRQTLNLDKSWWQRTLRDEVLVIELEQAKFQTLFTSGQSLQYFDCTANELHGSLKLPSSREPQRFVHVCGDGGEDGFNRPRVAVHIYQRAPISELEEDQVCYESTPVDSLNGICDFKKAEPSPFSSKKNMYAKEETDKNLMKTEEMVLPADKEEFREFQEKSLSNTKMSLDISLPNVCLFLPSKHFLEILYNRLCNDLLLWEPSAPSPVHIPDQYGSGQYLTDLNVFPQYPETFDTSKSDIHYNESDSDSDVDAPYYSIHDSQYHKRKRQPQQQQSKLCLALNIGKGRLTAFTDCKNSDGRIVEGIHSEILLQINEALLFVASCHNGDPGLQYIYVTASVGELYHKGEVQNTEFLPNIDCEELSAPVPAHLQDSQFVYRSEQGIQMYEIKKIGCGPESLDMVSLAVKIHLKTKASEQDLTTDVIVKEFTLSLGVRGATMQYRMALPNKNFFSQLIDFLDVKDYPVLGYMEPKVLTDFHVHLKDCAIDYRPLKLPIRTLVMAKSFTIASNVVAESTTTMLRFVLDDGVLFLSDKHKASQTDISKNYVCVANVERLELQIRKSDGKDQKCPKTLFQVSTNRLNLRTCSDSCKVLINLIQYLANDGDLDITMTTSNQEPDSAHEDMKHRDIKSGVRGRSGSSDFQLSKSKIEHVHRMMSEAMRESSQTDSNSESKHSVNGQPTKVYFIPDEEYDHFGKLAEAGHRPIVITANVDSEDSSMSERADEEKSDEDDGFCFIDDPGWVIAPRDGEPSVRVLTQTPIEIKDNYFAAPSCRTDLLQSPNPFPVADRRYTLKELNLVWYMYGGKDFDSPSPHEIKEKHSDTVITHMNSGKSPSVSFRKGSPASARKVSGLAGGIEAPPVPKKPLQTLSGPHRDHSKCMELHLKKVQFQHENYPLSAKHVARQILLVHDIEILDRLKSSKINKFLYLYSSEEKPRRTHANMVFIKALHRRPDPEIDLEECSLKVSLQPIRLNIDQDTLFFLHQFFKESFGKGSRDSEIAQHGNNDFISSSPKSNSSYPTPPLLTVKSLSPEEQSPGMLMHFDELHQDQQASFGSASKSSQESDTLSRGTPQSDQPVFFKSFLFSHDVPIQLDYHGKFDMERGTLAGLGGLVSLNRSELKLKKLHHQHGLLGIDKVVAFALNEWVTDIKVNQLPGILGGVGPMHSFVQLAQGLRDLFWMPVEQYRKDGRIIRGIKRGASSFSSSTAMSIIELTNRVVHGVQFVAELTFDMVSPGPKIKMRFSPRQPSDLREGVTNAYIVIREGFSETAQNFVDAASKEHDEKGMMGAVGGVLRQIPPTIVQPVIIGTRATSNILGGIRSQMKPDAHKEEEDKWKEEVI